MKQVIIGDIHGRSCWKDILAQEQDWDRVIFVGDYVDTHELITPLEQVDNLREIIGFKEDNDDKVILLIGNHDYHYWPGIQERYSGYQHNMRVSFEYEYDTYKRSFQACYIDEHKNIYSHAGLTQKWCQFIGAHPLKNKQLVDYVNDCFISRPVMFQFYRGDRSDYGDDINQGPFWVRPQSLYRDKIDNFQVVGHTMVGQITHPSKSERKGFYNIDCLPKQYLVCIDGEFEIRTNESNIKI